MTDSTISGNTGAASPVTGGIYNSYRGTLSLINSTVYANKSYYGGGMANADSITLIDSTVSGNTASFGGGIDNRGVLVSLDNTIVAGNNSYIYGPDIHGNINTANFTIIGSTTGNNGLTVSGTWNNLSSMPSPNLGPLTSNGGTTDTMALLPGSPGIGVGDPGQVGTVAQNGATRPAGLVDIGAYQTPQLPPTVTLNTGQFAGAYNASYIIITGTGFAANPTVDSVAFSDANGDIITGTVIAATGTSLTVTFTNGGVSGVATGTALDAVVTVGALNSGAPVQVATIGPAAVFPTVTQNTANLPDSSMTLTIDGAGFDGTTPGNNLVTFSLGVTGTVTASTTTTLTVTLTTPPTALGALFAYVDVTSSGLLSLPAVQVGTEVNGTWTVTDTNGAAGSSSSETTSPCPTPSPTR